MEFFDFERKKECQIPDQYLTSFISALGAEDSNESSVKNRFLQEVYYIFSPTAPITEKIFVFYECLR
jgi:hypothetical protein